MNGVWQFAFDPAMQWTIPDHVTWDRSIRVPFAPETGASEIGDRGEAIRRSVAALQPGDVLLVAGKGHESGQIVGDRILPFSDHEAVAAALKEKVA